MMIQLKMAVIGLESGLHLDDDGNLLPTYRITKPVEVKYMAEAIDKMAKLKLLTWGEETGKDELIVKVKLPDDLPEGFL